MSCEVLSEKIVTTRKPHFCFACGRTFPAGTKLHYQSNVCDGDIGSIYICETCDKLMGKARDDLYDDMDDFFPEYCVMNALEYNGFKTPEEWLEKIS